MILQTFDQAEKRGHEQIVFFSYPEIGLKAIVGIHSTVLGPALGGCRMRLYKSESEALDDVMRLSEGMTYKNSVAGLDLGGGKSCIIADPSMQENREKFFEKFGECVNNLGGRYISAEDMGTSVKDIMVMKKLTKFVSGTALEDGGGGDPSPWTARGVFRGMLAAMERRFGSKDLNGKHVTVQGVGHVGRYLVKHLLEAGAKVTACDTNAKYLDQVKNEYGIDITTPDGIYDVPCDIYAPCAVGQTINSNTISRFKCAIIAGAANNQLIDNSMHRELTKRNILYCPDFVINAGGVINCASESRKEGWSEAWTSEKVENIYNTMHQVLERAEKAGQFPEVTAVELAKERINKAKQMQLNS